MKAAFIRLQGTYSLWMKRPALGLAYMSAYLESKGFDCQIIDAHFNCWRDSDILRHVENCRPDIVGITAMTYEINRATRVASQIKNTLRIPIVIGGAHVTVLPERTLSEFPVFDYGIYGEGEKTAVELLQSLQKGVTDLSFINGLIFRDKDRVVVNPARPYLSPSELENLPYPAFHQYYGENKRALEGKNNAYVIMSTRGCPYRCAFCADSIGKTIRRRSAENVCKEVEYGMNRYGARNFDFLDDIFLFNDRETRRTLQLMIDSGLSDRIRWSGLVRANLVNPELIDLAKRSGCISLDMGAESGDDEVLKAINKRVTVDEIRRAANIIKKAGISLDVCYILGHPNETSETMRKTINLAAELNTEAAAFSLMVPFPGTKIFDMAVKGEGCYRLLTQDWSAYEKYGAKVLELENLSWEELVKWQVRAYLIFYLKNLRIADLIRFILKKRTGVYSFVKKRLSMRRARENGALKKMFYKIDFKCNNKEKIQSTLNYLYGYKDDISTKVLHRNRINLFSILMEKLIKEKRIESFDSAIDIGCNTGVYSKIISDYGFKHVLGIDISDEMIKKASISFAFREDKKVLEYKVADAERIETEKKYNLVLCTEVLEHTDNPENVIENIKSILAPNGIAIITTPNSISFPSLCTFLFHIINEGKINKEVKQHLSFPFYKSISLFKNSKFRVIETSGNNLVFIRIMTDLLYRLPIFATINKINFSLARLWPFKYFAQSFFVVWKNEDGINEW